MTGTDLVPYDPIRHRRDEALVERSFWRKLRRYGRHIPFLRDAVAAYYCARDPATPLRVKAVLMGALAYFVMPADMVPDIIAWLGFTDDATVVMAAIQVISPHIKERHHVQAQAAIDRLVPDDEAAQPTRTPVSQ